MQSNLILRKSAFDMNVHSGRVQTTLHEQTDMTIRQSEKYLKINFVDNINSKCNLSPKMENK